MGSRWGLMGRELFKTFSIFRARNVVGVYLVCQIDRQIELITAQPFHCFNNVTAMSPEVVGLGSVGASRQVAHAPMSKSCQAARTRLWREIRSPLFAELGYISRRHDDNQR